MSDIEQDNLEELLKQATPRPVPSPRDEAMVRAAVREEWHTVTAGRRSRRRAVQYAVAATVLLGVFGVLNVLRTPPIETVRVATVEKSIGAVFVLGEHSELQEVDSEMALYPGQSIVTHSDAGLALAWGQGGSLRIGANTRIEFRDSAAAFLESGRVYFDSQAEAMAAAGQDDDAPAFTLRTGLGDVFHVGTQYMGEVVDNALVVSVREGEVFVDGTFHQRTISSGQQVSMAGRQQPSILSISRSGEAWEWVNRTMPPKNVDGISVYEFVVWISREMGLEFEFSDSAEVTARHADLSGTIDTEPAKALRAWLASADLDWRIEGGVIHITD